VLSVILRYTDSDYAFGIFKLFLALNNNHSLTYHVNIYSCLIGRKVSTWSFSDHYLVSNVSFIWQLGSVVSFNSGIINKQPMVSECKSIYWKKGKSKHRLKGTVLKEAILVTEHQPFYYTSGTSECFLCIHEAKQLFTDFFCKRFTGQIKQSLYSSSFTKREVYRY
jgi:hypothetical protein